MYKILVPVDFSDTSKNALHYATQLLDQKSLEITVLNIFGAESTALMMKNIDDILIRDAEQQLNVLLDDIKAEAPDVTFKTKLQKNYAVSTIAALGDSGEYDLIVMGTKGVSGLKEVFVGSVAGGVIEKTSAPVIVVPLDYKFNGLNNVVFALGSSTIADSTNIKPLELLVQSNDSSLEVLDISDDTDAKQMVAEHLNHLNPKYTRKSGTGDINQHINVHISSNDTDLLCMLRTKKDFFSRLFNGSVTLKQTFNSTVPLLVLHE